VERIGVGYKCKLANRKTVSSIESKKRKRKERSKIIFGQERKQKIS